MTGAFPIEAGAGRAGEAAAPPAPLARFDVEAIRVGGERTYARLVEQHPGFARLAAALIPPDARDVRRALMARSLRLTPSMASEAHRIAREAQRVLGLGGELELYQRSGAENAAIHLVPALGRIEDPPLELALSRLSMMAELTADRIGLLACQDLRAMLRLEMATLTGLASGELTWDTDAYLAQCRELMERELRDGAEVRGLTHPEHNLRAGADPDGSAGTASGARRGATVGVGDACRSGGALRERPVAGVDLAVDGAPAAGDQRLDLVEELAAAAEPARRADREHAPAALPQHARPVDVVLERIGAAARVVDQDRERVAGGVGGIEDRDRDLEPGRADVGLVRDAGGLERERELGRDRHEAVDRDPRAAVGLGRAGGAHEIEHARGLDAAPVVEVVRELEEVPPSSSPPAAARCPPPPRPTCPRGRSRSPTACSVRRSSTSSATARSTRPS
jgi:hypothetical protein